MRHPTQSTQISATSMQQLLHLIHLIQNYSIFPLPDQVNNKHLLIIQSLNVIELAECFPAFFHTCILAEKHINAYRHHTKEEV
jgi:hypothetical protein